MGRKGAGLSGAGSSVVADGEGDADVESIDISDV